MASGGQSQATKPMHSLSRHRATKPNTMATQFSKSKFKKVILKIKAASYLKMKITEEAMRYLRREVLVNVRSAADVKDVVDLALAALQAANVRAVTREALDVWLAIAEPRPATSDEATASTPPTSGATVPEQMVEVIDLTADNDTEAASVVRADEGDASDSSETEWQPSEDLRGRPLYQARRILRAYKRNGKWIYLVAWEPTEEPAENLTRGLIAAFHRKRRTGEANLLRVDK